MLHDSKNKGHQQSRDECGRTRKMEDVIAGDFTALVFSGRLEAAEFPLMRPTKQEPTGSGTGNRPRQIVLAVLSIMNPRDRP